MDIPFDMIENIKKDYNINTEICTSLNIEGLCTIKVTMTKGKLKLTKLFTREQIEMSILPIILITMARMRDAILGAECNRRHDEEVKPFKEEEI